MRYFPIINTGLRVLLDVCNQVDNAVNSRPSFMYSLQQKQHCSYCSLYWFCYILLRLYTKTYRDYNAENYPELEHCLSITRLEAEWKKRTFRWYAHGTRLLRFSLYCFAFNIQLYFYLMYGWVTDRKAIQKKLTSLKEIRTLFFATESEM